MNQKPNEVDEKTINQMIEEFGFSPESFEEAELVQVKTKLDSNKPDKVMYDRLGVTVRHLHDSIRDIGYEQKVLDETLIEISGSQDRLNYIATLTEQAANKVLNAVDEAMPIQSEQLVKSKVMIDRWTLLLNSMQNSDELADLVDNSISYAQQVADNSESEKDRLMVIMMAQDFQDITGQIIKKIVGLTQTLEIELAQILKDFAPKSASIDKPVDLLSGPIVPDLALVQDDVDSMLADLGF
jgi:chemotaxis protein CheZ